MKNNLRFLIIMMCLTMSSIFVVAAPGPGAQQNQPQPPTATPQPSPNDSANVKLTVDNLSQVPGDKLVIIWSEKGGAPIGWKIIDRPKFPVTQNISIKKSPIPITIEVFVGNNMQANGAGDVKGSGKFDFSSGISQNCECGIRLASNIPAPGPNQGPAPGQKP